MATTVETEPITYKEMGDNLSSMKEEDLVKAIQEELAGPKRTDMLARLVGRFNRVRGARVKHQVFASLGAKKPGDVNQLLDRYC